MKIKVAALALVVCSLSPLAHADFINGSFEDPNIGAANILAVTGDNVPGWNIAGLSHIVSNGYDGSAAHWHSTPAGNQYLYMNSSVAGGFVVSQTVSLLQGGNSLDFLQADFNSVFVTPGGQLTVTITRASDSQVIVGPTLFTTPDLSDFIQQTLPFSAPTDGDYLFEFTSIANHAGIIDDVHVNGQPVPEPATMAVLALGALALKRRRRASN